MRIKISFEGSNSHFKNNSLHLVKGWFEQAVLGKNNVYHDAPNDYSLSPMLGGVRDVNGESFPKGGYVLFTTSNTELFDKVWRSLLFNCCGNTFVGDLKCKSFEMSQIAVHSDFDVVRTISPVLLKDKYGKNITINNGVDAFLERLTITSVKNLIRHGIEPKVAETLKFNVFHPEGAKLVPMYYRNKCNFSTKIMLVVTGDKKARETLYDLGLGQSTGCGFGTVLVLDENR